MVIKLISKWVHHIFDIRKSRKCAESTGFNAPYSYRDKFDISSKFLKEMLIDILATGNMFTTTIFVIGQKCVLSTD